ALLLEHAKEIDSGREDRARAGDHERGGVRFHLAPQRGLERVQELEVERARLAVAQAHHRDLPATFALDHAPSVTRLARRWKRDRSRSRERVACRAHATPWIGVRRATSARRAARAGARRSLLARTRARPGVARTHTCARALLARARAVGRCSRAQARSGVARAHKRARALLAHTSALGRLNRRCPC